MNLDSSVVSSSLTAYTQAGRVIYDLNLGVYRVRELSQEPLDMSKLRFSSPQEEKANQLIEQQKVKIAHEVKKEQLHIVGTIVDSNFKFKTLAVIDKDNRLIDAKCQCNFFTSNALKHGPCDHVLATRMAFNKI